MNLKPVVVALLAILSSGCVVIRHEQTDGTTTVKTTYIAGPGMNRMTEADLKAGTIKGVKSDMEILMAVYAAGVAAGTKAAAPK